MKVAVFTDNDFDKINGVTTTLTAVLRYAPPEIKPRIYTAAPLGADQPEYLALRSFGVGIPFYREMKMYLPHWRQYLERVQRDHIDVIHLTTPGPLGLVALWVAAQARLPLVGSFHTDLSAYTRLLSGSERLGTLMQEYMRWMYGHCRRVLVPSDSRYRLLLPGSYLAPNGRLRKILEDEQPDLIEICDKYSLFYLAALLRKQWLGRLKRPTLVGLSCERMDDNVSAYVSTGRLGRAISGAYIRHMYGPPFDAHVANSEYTASELRRSLWDRSPGFIHVRPMGVDAGAFGPAHRDRQFRRRLLVQAGGHEDSVLLLYAGRLSPEKNLGLLIDTLEQLQQPAPSGDPVRDYRLVLAGDGPATEAFLSEAAHRVRHRVLWVGNVRDRGQLAAYYASADVFVHPNPREPFGIGPLEAMASRVPVVLPSAGGVLSYANPSNAWLAEPSGTSFAHAVRSAVMRRSEGRIAAAHETARQLEWGRVASSFFKLYDDLHRRRLAAAAPSGRVPQQLSLAAGAAHDFALSTTVSHRIVTGLGHSTFKSNEPTAD